MSHVDEGQLHAFLDGELTPGEEERIQAHMTDCLECATLFEETAEAHAGAASLLVGVEAGSAPEWAELVARAEAGEESTPQPGFLRPALAWAATLVLAFFLGWQANRDVASPDAVSIPLPRARPAAPAPEGIAEEAKGLDALSDAVAVASPAEQDLEVPVEEAATQEDRGVERQAFREGAASATPAAAPVQVPETVGAASEEQSASAISAPPPARQRMAEPEALQATGGLRAQPRSEAAASLGETGRRDAAEDDGFVPIRPSEAAGWLGAEPLRLPLADLREVAVGPATRFVGGAAGQPVVRFTYDLSGRDLRLVIWQQREMSDARAPGEAFADGDTLESLDEIASDDASAANAAIEEAPASLRSDGLRMLEWADPRGYRVRLAARLPIDELRELATRLRRDP